MSTPVIEGPGHLPLPLNADGQGPEFDEDKIVIVVCHSCTPLETWPCAAAREESIYGLEPPD